MKHKDFHILSPFTVKVATTPLHDPDTVDTGDSEIIKISGIANFFGDAEAGDIYIDLAHEIVNPNGIDVSAWKANPQMLWQHQRNVTIGRGTSITKKKSGLYIEAEIHAKAMCPEDFYRIKSGLVTRLSIGFRVLEGSFKKVGDNNVYVIEKSKLFEVSVVSLPCNEESSFQIVKSLPDEEGFYAGELKNFSHPSDKDIHFQIQEGEVMKLSAEKAAGLGIELKHEGEVEVSQEQFIEALVATEFKKRDDAAEEKAAAEQASLKEAEEKAAAEQAEKEAQEAEEKAAAEQAEKEAQEADEAASIKSLEDIVGSLKTLVTG